MIDLTARLAGLSPAKRELLEQKLRQNPQIAEPIAIVGMACRFPGAANLQEFWRLIVEGIEAVGEVPPDRWNADEFYDPDFDAPGKMATRWGGFVRDLDQFDPQFFGITPREAARTDPQQRLLLEVGWEALEHACLAPERMAGSKTGVFVGIGGTDYSKIPMHYEDYMQYLDAHMGTGNALSIAANRVSYAFDLRGPSLAIDTACSSGLVAVHLAVQALRNRDCDAALAGAVNVICSPEVSVAFSKARMLSPDGHCRPFDAGANGYVRGEGAAMLVCKRLTDAVAAGDNVLAVIRGSAVNQDGKTSGITAPSSRAQQAVIQAALATAGVPIERVNYIEAHGTGTPLGDPIEMESLTTLFRRRSDSDSPCYVTSAKANIGHTETVSGVVGLIKVALMMRHGVVPGQLHLKELNPHISLAGSRLEIPRAATAWPRGTVSRIAGVSSFGFGGTNAHVVIEEAAARPPVAGPRERPLHVLPLSAKSKPALTKLAGEYLAHLDAHPDESLADFCFSAAAGRSHFQHRAAAVAESREQLREQLTALREGRTAAGLHVGQVTLAARPKVAFVFTGQGSQYVGMGRTLYDSQPVFRDALNQCDELLREHLPQPLLAVLFPPAGQPSPLDETAYTQPALFSLEYALAMLWRSWGIETSLVLGHSVGEYVAACLAGVFSLEDALWLIAQRARLMQALPQNGLMAVVFAPVDRVQKSLAPYADSVAIAAANGPENTVISGQAESVRALVAQFQQAQIGTQLLSVSHAFHSPLMEPMLDEFERLAGEVEFARPRLELIANLTGELSGDSPPTASYWRRHIRQTVRFAEGLQTLAAAGPHAVVEIGPAASLIGMGKRALPKLETAWLPSLRKGQDDWRSLLDSLAQLYLLGVRVNWPGFDQPWPRRRLALPTYPFERTRHWFEAKTPKRGSGSGGIALRGPAVHPLLGSRVPTALDTTLFEVGLSDTSPAYLTDHQVQGSPVTPGAAYLEQGLAAAKDLLGPGVHAVENVTIQQAMFLTAGSRRSVQVAVSPELSGRRSFEVYSVSSDSAEAAPRWQMHASGSLRHADGLQDEPRPAPVDVEQVRERVQVVKEREEFYRVMGSRGLAYGSSFQVLGDLHCTGTAALAEVRLPESVRNELDKYHLHPALLDGGMQAVAGIVPRDPDGSYSPFTYMPTGVQRVRMFARPAERMFVYAVRTSADDRPSPDSVEGNIYLLDEQGAVLVELIGVRVQRLGRSSGKDKADDSRSWLYQVQWQPEPLPPPKTAGQNGSVSTATWLIFADRAGVGLALAERFRREHQRCLLVVPGKEFAKTGGNGQDPSDTFFVDPLSSTDYQRLIAEVLAPGQPPCAGVIHLWSLDVPPLPASADLDAGAQALAEARRLGSGSVLQLVQQLARAKFAKYPNLWLVTRGAQPVAKLDEAVAAGQSPLWGFGRVAAVEHPELHSRLVDLDPEADVAGEAQRLWNEIEADAAEDQIAFRSGERRVARLRPAPELVPAESQAANGEHLTVPVGSPFRLRLGTAGSFDSLRWEAVQRRQPPAGQVEVEVLAAGLNFSDVLKALGLYPGLRDGVVPLGIECSGRVTAVGEGVTRFRLGDEVLGVAALSLASHTLTASEALVHKPAGISHVEAAGLPIAFLTAYYGLVRLAQLQPGEKVLIHAGAGGVGLAAIQIAQHIGAEIFATAGSDPKREYLRSLGVPHVLNSRGLEFADEILRITGRRGVDVVLNSLPGEAITKSLAILAAYGRFLEIGKTDIYQNRMLGLAPFQDNLSYFAIDLDRMLRQRPEYSSVMLCELIDHVQAGHYRPLVCTEFPVGETIGAFRYMAQRKNIGKVIVSLADRSQEAAATTLAARPATLVRQDGTYLISGGLGKLGLQLARWLTEQGARHLVLLARRAPVGDAAASIESLRAAGASVTVLQADVADAPVLKAALASLSPDLPPLRGVFHAAGVLDDGVLFDMDLARFDKPFTPKVQGAWNLHAATLDAPLDLFVMFSSVASLLGSPGQGNYAAGNAFLDGLAALRRSQGQPATSINWGPWAEAGMAADAATSAQLAARGINLLPAEPSLQILGGLLEAKAVSAAVMSVRWGDMLRQTSGGTPPLLLDVAPQEAAPAPVENADDASFRQRLATLPLPERQAELRGFFTKQLAKIMGLAESQLDVAQPLNTMGLDSLMAIELKNSIETRLKVVLPMARFMEGPSVTSLSSLIADSMGAGQAAATEVTAGGATNTGRQPLSQGQQALWFLHRLAPQSAAYNICDAVRARGPLDLAAQRQALQTLVDRHAMFRTTFHDEDGQPYQQIHEGQEVNWRVVDAAGLSESEVQRQLADEICRPFDLELGPVHRVTVFQLGPEEFLLVFVVHHIVADFWTMIICVEEFTQLYAALRNGERANIIPPRVAYGDFVRWQAEMLAGPEGEAQWNYWKGALAGELPVLDLPTDKPRPSVPSYNGSLAFRQVPAELSARVKKLADSCGTTLNVFLLAAYQVLLHRLSGQDEVLVGVPTSGRTRAEFAGVAGYFVNPVVIRGDLAADPTFRDFLTQVQERMHGALDHQDFPFPLLVERLAPKRDAGRTPLFQTLFAMRKAQLLHEEGLTEFLTGEAGAKLNIADITYESLTMDEWSAQFDLTMIASEAAGCLTLALQFSTDLFERATAERMLAALETLLAAIAADPQTSVGQLNLLTADERTQIVDQWNDTERTWQSDALVYEAIEAQAARQPEAIAVQGGGDEPLTYRQLNERANQLAHRLRELGVGPDVRVGVCLHRCPDLLVALLGVLKAGGAYVPLDPAYPQSRLADITQGAGLFAVVTHQRHQERLGGGAIVRMDADRDDLARRPTENPQPVAGPDNLIYVIFTSGSTGKPKGAGVYHRSFKNLVHWLHGACQITPADCSLVFTSHGFDLMQKNLLGMLAAGGRLHLYCGAVYDPAEVAREIAESQATLLICTPSGFYPLVNEGGEPRFAQLASLRCVQLAGESMDVARMSTWLQSPLCRAELHNAYGPTECTDIAAWQRLTGPLSYAGKIVPIGRPIENARMYIVDRRMNPAPVGVAGEICIGGLCVGAGYVNDPELTAKKFLPDPFSRQPGARLYRTGDLGRFLPDGRIEYLGRADQQVKIRGFRIELGEIESVLVEHPAIREAVVVARASGDQTQLVAYLIPQSPESTPAVRELADHVKAKLPDYMTPAAFVWLEAFPLTAHGKLDKRALPAPELGRPRQAAGYVAPRSVTEARLAHLWEEVLHVKPIGVHDNFFELGGHSLRAVQIASRVRQAFQVELPLHVLFQAVTIADLAKAIEAGRPQGQSDLPLVPIQPSGKRPPLFCIHPAGGRVLSYFGLADQLGADQPVFGLQAPGVDGDGQPHRTLAQKVADFAAAIRRAQPAGPYYLCGWSFGGVVAYELAGQLRREGAEVAAVIMLDTALPSLRPIDMHDHVGLLLEMAQFLSRLSGASLPLSREELASLAPDERLALVHNKALAAGAIPPDVTIEQFRASYEVSAAELGMLATYEPQQHEVPVHLVKAQDDPATANLNDDLGWRIVLGSSLTTYQTPGDHVTHLQGSNVPHVAQIVRDILR